MIFEWLEQIPGPLYLFLYLIVAIVTYFVARNFLQRDGSENMKMPEPSAVSPYEVAFLQGGIKQLIQTVTFVLMQQGRLLSTEEGKIAAKKSAKANDAVENEILEQLATPDKVSSLMKVGVINAIKDRFARSESHLQSLGLWMSSEHLLRQKKIQNIALAVVLFFGISKMVLGIMNDRPTGFLIFATIVFGLFFYVKFKPQQTVTNLGKRFLASTRQRLSETQRKQTTTIDDDIHTTQRHTQHYPEQHTNPNQQYEYDRTPQFDMSSAMMVAMFGLAGMSMMDSFANDNTQTLVDNWQEESHHKHNSDGSISGGDSSYSGDSSGDSGGDSGCGGGSGCGGCGGGGD